MHTGNVKKESNIGDSYFYVFAEEGWTLEKTPFFKIGITFHNITDEGVKKWPKYLDSEYPVSITRRILKLNNGNPRKIVPVLWLQYGQSKNVNEKNYPKSLESKWLRKLRNGIISANNHSCEPTHSPEWFKTKNKSLHFLINEILREEKEVASIYWSALV